MDTEEAHAILAWADTHAGQVILFIDAMDLFDDSLVRNDIPRMRGLGEALPGLIKTVRARVIAPAEPTQLAAWNRLLSLGADLGVAASMTTADTGPVGVMLFQIRQTLAEMRSLVETAQSVTSPSP
jgi:hypothetical protein